MSQSLAQIYLHVVFSTRSRLPFLSDEDVRCRLHGYLVQACKALDCPALKIGGVEDHVHLLLRLGKTTEVSSLVRDLKRESSKWIKAKNVHPQFAWQNGYGAFSCSPAHVDPLIKYISNQVEHHKKFSFKEEFQRICDKYGVNLDERYAWD